MAIEREKGNIIFVCNDCGERCETEVDDFKEALEILKDEGWKYEKIDNEWEHLCPQCR